jgi:triosephosphate isomerase
MINKKIICGNWKMNPRSFKEAEKLFNDLTKDISSIKKTEIVACPPFLYMEKLKKISKKIVMGAQDAFPGDIGAFTGEVSVEMLYNLGVKYVILGHSERRTMGETSSDVNKKIKSSLAIGLRPILCVGESARNDNHDYFNFIKTQLEESLAGISKNSAAKITIAYEPVWAISTTLDRRDATADDSREMTIFIRKILFDKFGKESSQTRVLYGGSINEKNAEEFLKNGGIDGLLVGKTSLDAKKFTKIIKTCEALNK